MEPSPKHSQETEEAVVKVTGNLNEEDSTSILVDSESSLAVDSEIESCFQWSDNEGDKTDTTEDEMDLEMESDISIHATSDCEDGGLSDIEWKLESTSDADADDENSEYNWEDGMNSSCNGTIGTDTESLMSNTSINNSINNSLNNSINNSFNNSLTYQTDSEQEDEEDNSSKVHVE